MARILVVDDERSIRDTFSIFLTNENHTVLLAENVEEALKIIKNNSIDLILSDIIMPKNTGIELLEQTKEISPDIPFVIMTGEPTVDTAKEAVKGKAFDYLIKPISKLDLLNVVKYALTQKELLDSKKELEENRRIHEKQLEELLTQRTEAFETMKKILELSPMPTFIVDIVKNEVFSANKAMLEFMKVKDCKDIRKTNFFENNNDFSTIKSLYKEKGKIDNAEVQIKCEGTGELIWCLLSVHPINLADRQLIIISFTEFNEVLEAKRQLQIAKQKAEDANKLKSQFLANMSHEIRTPMNAIIGLGELMKSADLAPKYENYLDKLNLSAKNLLALINDILDFSKLESEKFELENKGFYISDVLENIKNIVSFSANERKLDFSIMVEESVPKFVLGDSLRLGQVLLNLSNNAIKFTDKGEVTITVRKASDTKESTNVLFAIKDTGIGISEENKDKLFSSFTQADSSVTRKYGGSGLGLAISKNIVKLMGGEIWFESELGVGTTFYLNIPFKKAVDQKNSGGRDTLNDIDSKQKKQTKPISSTNISRVLLAEDNEINQMVTGEMLRQLGYETEIAENGEVAISKVMSDKYDLVLMDLQMPVMGGYEASQKIREKNKDIPIIALSAETMPNILERIYDSGMNDYISKPVEINTLKDILKKWIKK